MCLKFNFKDSILKQRNVLKDCIFSKEIFKIQVLSDLLIYCKFFKTKIFLFIKLFKLTLRVSVHQMNLIQLILHQF